jgi:hypothetical protein
MQARALFGLAFALGCGTSSSPPDMLASVSASDMAMPSGQPPQHDMGPLAGPPHDMAPHAGPPHDMAKARPPADMTLLDGGTVPTLYTLTVYNTVHWCDVTVTINGHATEFSTQDSMTFMATATTTVMLKATPNPGYFAVKWTGVSTMSGSMATYVMTSAANQSVTACCPTSAGGANC